MTLFGQFMTVFLFVIIAHLMVHISLNLINRSIDKRIKDTKKRLEDLLILDKEATEFMQETKAKNIKLLTDMDREIQLTHDELHKKIDAVSLLAIEVRLDRARRKLRPETKSK